MASEFVGAFLSSDQTERVSLYSQLLLALENNGFEDVEAVTKLTLEDCVHETELGNAAVSFLSKLISHERIQKSVKLRRAILNGSRKTLDAIGEMFGEGHVEYKLRNIFTAWTELFAGLLKEAEEVKVVINTLCPPLKDAISSKREVVAEGALGVWRSLIDAFFATFADKPSTRFSDTHLLVFMDFMLRPLKYMPDFCLEAKFETWVHLAGAVGQYSSQCYELVVLGLIRMSVGGSVEVVEPTRDVCSEAIAAVSDHSALLVEKCDLKIAEEWMKRKMRRHGVLAKSGISILATLLDVRLPEGSDCRARYKGIFTSLPSSRVSHIHPLMLAGCIRIYSYYLERDSQALSQVHVQLWSVWAALCRVIVDKVIDAPKRVFALRHVIAHFIGWINESHLSHDLIIHAFLMLCDGQYFPNGSSEYTISHAFVAVLRKLAAGANPSLLRQLCEAALKNVSACSDAVRLRLLKTITDGVLDAAPNRQCPQSAVVWIYVAAALTVHSNKTQDLNEGSATDVRYITTDKVLMFPLECCCAAQLRQSELAKQLFDFWKRLYISVQTTNAREANASGFSCAVRTANSLIKAVNDNEVNSDTLMVGSHLLRIIVETFPFTALGESIFEGGNDDPLETLCKMIVVFGGRVLDAISAKKCGKESESGVEYFRCALGNLLTAVHFAFSALSSTMHSISLLTNLSPFIAHLIQVSSIKDNDALFKSCSIKVQELVKMSCKSVESNYCGPFCSELLSKIEPLFIYGFRSSNLSIRLALADFWRKTFAKSSKLQCSPILRDVLISLRGKLRLAIPMVLETRADFPCFDRDSSVLSMSQQTTKDFDKDLSDSEVTVPLVKPLTPVRESASIAPRTGCDRPANKRQSVDFRGDNERFEVIEPQSATKRMRLTEHQKEKLRARGEVMALMNDDLSQDDSRTSPIILPSLYIVDSSQSSLSSLSSRDQNSSHLPPTQPIAATEVEERAPKSKEESPEVIEESPPREPSKTPRRLCRSVDIRSYLSPSGTAAQKSPPKASSAPQKSKKSFPRRLQFSGKKWVPEEGVSASPTSSKSASADRRRRSSRIAARKANRLKDDEIRKLTESIDSTSDEFSQIIVEKESPMAVVEEVVDMNEEDVGSESSGVRGLTLNLDLHDPSESSIAVVDQPFIFIDHTPSRPLMEDQFVTQRSIFLSFPAVNDSSPEAIDGEADLNKEKSESSVEGTPGILKKVQSASAESPFTSEKKVRRVHFDVLQMDEELETIGHTSKRVRRRPVASLFHTSQEKASQEQLSAVAQFSPLKRLSSSTDGNDKAFVFPELVHCTDAIPPQMFFKLGGPRGLEVRNDFRARGLLTVGDLARLSEEEVRLLSVRKPQVKTVRSLLAEYASHRSNDAVMTLSLPTAGDSEVANAVEEEKENDEEMIKLSEEKPKQIRLLAFAEQSHIATEGVVNSDAYAEDPVKGFKETSLTKTESDIIDNSESIQAEAISTSIQSNDGAAEMATDEEHRISGSGTDRDWTHGINNSVESAETQPLQERMEKPKQRASSVVTVPNAEGGEEIRISLDSCRSDESVVEPTGSQSTTTNVVEEAQQSQIGKASSCEKAGSVTVARNSDARSEPFRKLEQQASEIEGVDKESGNEERMTISEQMERTRANDNEYLISPAANDVIIRAEVEDGLAKKSAKERQSHDSGPVERDNSRAPAVMGPFTVKVATATGEELPMSVQRKRWYEAWEAIERMSALIGDDSRKPSPEELLAIHSKLSFADAVLSSGKHLCDTLVLSLLKH